MYWDPYTRIDHAWMCLEKLNATIQIGPDGDKFTCLLWIEDEFFAPAQAETRTAAISIAMLQAVEEVEHETK